MFSLVHSLVERKSASRSRVSDRASLVWRLDRLAEPYERSVLHVKVNFTSVARLQSSPIPLASEEVLTIAENQ